MVPEEVVAEDDAIDVDEDDAWNVGAEAIDGLSETLRAVVVGRTVTTTVTVTSVEAISNKRNSSAIRQADLKTIVA